MSRLVVIHDIDDVWHPWCDLAHEASIIAGLCEVGTPCPNTWEPYETYGCSPQDWFSALDLATRTGFLHQSEPRAADLEAFDDLTDAGVEHHFVTARGFMDNADLIREITASWLDTHFDGKYETLTFSKQKGDVAKRISATHAIDDNLGNVEDLERAGVRTFLMDKPWNHERTPAGVTRVKSIREFADRILEGVTS
ncbi:MAG: hypothetical protein H7288_05085 [Kineosporiaceae bacterium]|nr:hypothetical protein [Aeromicrobium sp.]